MNETHTTPVGGSTRTLDLVKIARRESATAGAGATIGLHPMALGAGTTAALSARLDLEPRPASVGIGRILRDRYVLEERLGSGGMGTVFKALDRYRADLPEANRHVAIKILHPNADNRAHLLENLRREFYCTQMLSHRNVVKVFELDRDGDVDFFSMELLEGELLSSVTDRLHLQPMPRPYAWAIIREIGAGLVHAHARGVIHTDLKPQNIMITRAGEVRILDFGASSHPAAQGAENSGRRYGQSAVTPAYACCELLAGRPADPRDDIYAFACIAYELLAGAHPFQRRPSTVARDLGVVPTRPPNLGGRQWRALLMGLAWHRAARSKSVRAWLDRLDAGRAAATQLPCPRNLRPAPASVRPLGSLKAAMVFAVLLVTVAVWASFIRAAPGKRADGGYGSTTAAVGPAEGPSTAVASTAVASAAASDNLVGDRAPLGAVPHSSASSSTAKHDAGRAKPPSALPNPIIVTAGGYTIRSGENFAEIRVHRAPQLSNDTPFVWWTEPASAKPGIDYVHQGKVTQSFPKGKNSTSFFIKLVPRPYRTQPEVFYVAIAPLGRGASPGLVERAKIWLPTGHHS